MGFGLCGLSGCDLGLTVGLGCHYLWSWFWGVVLCVWFWGWSVGVFSWVGCGMRCLGGLFSGVVLLCQLRFGGFGWVCLASMGFGFAWFLVWLWDAWFWAFDLVVFGCSEVVVLWVCLRGFVGLFVFRGLGRFPVRVLV